MSTTDDDGWVEFPSLARGPFPDRLYTKNLPANATFFSCCASCPAKAPAVLVAIDETTSEVKPPLGWTTVGLTTRHLCPVCATKEGPC